MPDLERADWTLLAAVLADGNPLTPVQLQKSVFLLQERLPKEVLPAQPYEFVPYNYGPFCGDVYTDARMLAEQNFMGISTVPSGRYAEYAATDEGVTHGQNIVRALPDEVAQHARRIVEWVRAQSFTSLVSAIYDEYPSYRVNSIFRG